MATLITSQSSDTFSFKESFEKHKKLILILSILVVISFFAIIAIPSEETINAYFGYKVIK